VGFRVSCFSCEVACSSSSLVAERKLKGSFSSAASRRVIISGVQDSSGSFASNDGRSVLVCSILDRHRQSRHARTPAPCNGCEQLQQVWCTEASLLDHLLGERKQRWRNRDEDGEVVSTAPSRDATCHRFDEAVMQEPHGSRGRSDNRCRIADDPPYRHPGAARTISSPRRYASSSDINGAILPGKGA